MDKKKIPQSRTYQFLVQLFKKKILFACFAILLCYGLVALLVELGWLATDWHSQVGASCESPNWINYFGTDILGRSVLAKVLHGIQVAMTVGCLVALSATLIGVVLGMFAGYFGGIFDGCIVWIYTVLSSIPNMLLLMVVPFMVGKGVFSVCLALILTEWIEICRLVRGEVLRHKNRAYVQAARAIGASTLRRIFFHILPNIASLIVVQFSLVFQNAIKYEVILSYLGLGVQDHPSWGIMISDAKSELLRGVWWEFTFATLFMFVLVLVFNVLADALRDALDPKR